MTLSEMRQVLVEHCILLTKSLGQNFLHDGNQLRRIVAAADLKPTDQVLEIGPGLGPLTELLLAGAGKVLAIEKDRRLFDFLQHRFAGTSNLTLLHDDALDYLRAENRDWSSWKLVANLPYSVASPILVELALAAGCPERLVATLQLEVARRILARAGDDDYGLLSVLVQLNFASQPLLTIPATCFFPAPDVDSACVTLIRRAHLRLAGGDLDGFVRLVKLSFSQRRKMMFKLLKTQWLTELLASAFAAARLDPQTRAEQVEVEQFVQLARFVSRGNK